MTERTDTIRELFHKSSPYRPGGDDFAELTALKSHTFYETFQVVTSTAKVAVRNTRASIKAALRAMEQFSPAVSDQESALLLQEAELLAASDAIKELIASLKNACVQSEKSGSRWGAAVSRKGDEAQDAKTGKPSNQMLLHLETALEVVGLCTGRWRLLLALCKEELILYKQEMFSFGRIGVLSCQDPVKEKCGDAESSISRREPDVERPRELDLPIGCSVEKPKDATQAVMSVVDRVMKEAARRVTVAPLPLNSGVWSKIRGNKSNCRNVWNADISEVPVPQFEYSLEEQQQLRVENAMLEKHQRLVSAEDAKAVEVSVRELSQLTSLISERVIQQNEQFSILLKNTEAAQNNMQRGIGEVKQTLTHFWNPTRQLIAILWTSIIVLLLANWIIR
ncbi:hypothetical protein DPX39_100106700 [Trypanosoma brucei equiperdum]|uniref:t-SNARE coiled-coil homology domain-containing protein n=1 Tax=Trypanosoma brucei equiperdum TaxID=630700 RepID=A0A3L6KZ44_9TRYP|nr:hypothetical protein DPX39_100106700 [Trypanosoma brucei equiperdum]